MRAQHPSSLLLLTSKSVLGGAVGLLVAVASCSDSPPAQVTPDGGVAPTELLPGERCDADNRAPLNLIFDTPTTVDAPGITRTSDKPRPGVIIVAPGESRPARLTVEPDFCEPNEATFASDNPGVAEAPPTAKFDLRHATYDFVVKGGAIGRTKIVATMKAKDPNGQLVTYNAEIVVDVRDRAAPTCAGETAEGALGAGTPAVAGTGSLARAKLSFPAAAFTRTDEWSLPSFPATLACSTEELTLAPSLAEGKLRKLGPAVTFGARAPMTMAKSLRREFEASIPINPAAFPERARLRHLVVLYKGPRVKTPRAIPIANPRIEGQRIDPNNPDSPEEYVLKFQTPWFGTYQAAVAEDAGTRMKKKKIAHRAVIGFSMGGGGAAIFGLRHHDKFDVVAPLGGPSDWTWLLWYIENHALGGFCPAGKTCPKVEPNRYPFDEVFAHSMDYEHWFYQKGSGNGGSFPRSEYVQIFEDLALSLGNPNGSSSDPGLLHIALGPKKTDPWVSGDPSFGLPPGTDCSFTVEPINPEDENDPAQKAAQEKQRDIEAKCKAFRCDPKNVYKAPANYFDDEYNPDGTLPVISFCDGGQKPDAPSPYVNTWAPGGTKPMNLGLAVDLNNNGIRDEGEPVIRAGHEPYDDCGADGLCNPQEPGYDAELNPDPNQDDYDYQLNPNGLEGNHRWDQGEPYKDFGLDGVADTASRHIAGDPGEGDGKFTESIGLANFYANDAHSILSKRVTDLPGGPMTDEALGRIDILSDGGVRDLFNFAAVANHLTGQVFGRQRPGGLPLRSVSFYNGFDYLPGEPIGQPNYYNPSLIHWRDVADMPSVRYGDLDAPQQLIEQGDGQHVGTASQLLHRLETAFFFVGERWPGADRLQTIESRENPGTTTINEQGIDCELKGTCQKIFTGPRSGRTGPISVSLPPGYALDENIKRNTRYPVLYVLHGYGQDPRDLEAVAIFTNNFMSPPEKSYATRLPKFIIVYVDGRCRVRPDGKPECIRGTFYMNSARPDGAKLDDWFDEVTEYVDQNYRTMPTTEVEVAE